MSHGVSLHPLSPLELSLESSALVEASAGTGKTFAITTIFLRLLLERQIDVSKILVVTFTKAATAELRDRIRRRIRDALDFFRGAAAGDDETLTSLFEAAWAAGTVERDVRSLEQALQGFDEAADFHDPRFLSANAARKRVRERLSLRCDPGDQRRSRVQRDRSRFRRAKAHVGSANCGRAVLREQLDQCVGGARVRGPPAPRRSRPSSPPRRGRSGGRTGRVAASLG